MKLKGTPTDDELAVEIDKIVIAVRSSLAESQVVEDEMQGTNARQIADVISCVCAE